MVTVCTGYKAEKVSSNHKNGDTSPGYLVIWETEWGSPIYYFLLIDALKVSLWAFWIGFNCWRIWLPVSRTNCTNNKSRSVQLLKKQVLATIYDELSFKHYHLHSTTRKKYTILIYNVNVLRSVLSPLHCHYDPLLRHNKVTNSNNQLIVRVMAHLLHVSPQTGKLWLASMFHPRCAQLEDHSL